MLTRHIICFALSTCTINAIGQDAPVKTNRKYYAWVSMTDSLMARKGLLMATADSGLYLADLHHGRPQDTYYLSDEQLETIQFRRIESVATGAAIVGVVGIFLGLGFSGHGGTIEPTWVIGPFAGAGIGAMMGSARITFKIGRKHERYARLRSRIELYKTPQ